MAENRGTIIIKYFDFSIALGNRLSSNIPNQDGPGVCHGISLAVYTVQYNCCSSSDRIKTANLHLPAAPLMLGVS